MPAAALLVAGLLAACAEAAAADAAAPPPLPGAAGSGGGTANAPQQPIRSGGANTSAGGGKGSNGKADHSALPSKRKPQVVLAATLGFSSLLVCLAIGCVMCRQAAEDKNKVSIPGGDDAAQEEMERQDILAEVYGNAARDGGDGEAGDSPDPKNAEIDRAWKAIQQECNSSDDEDVNQLLAAEEYLDGEDFFLGKSTEGRGAPTGAASSSANNKQDALATFMD